MGSLYKSYAVRVREEEAMDKVVSYTTLELMERVRSTWSASSVNCSDTDGPYVSM